MLLLSQFSSFSTAAGPGPKAQGGASYPPETQTIRLRGGYYQNYTIHSFSANTTVSYAASSSSGVPFSTALMTANQFSQWYYNNSDLISNSLTYQNGTSVQNSMTIGSGQYSLVFYAYYSGLVIQYGLQVDPSTPYNFGAISSPLAMGISTFGISNHSGTVTPYQVQTSEIVGLANISSAQVNTPNAYQYGVSPTGFTVQLNAMLVVNDGSSLQKVYWVQNVPDLETGSSQMYFGDEIWNNTDTSGFLSNQTITSTNFQNGGYVYTTGANRFSPGEAFYSYSTNNETYVLPFNFGLVMKATTIPGTGVMVQTGYRLLSNGSSIHSQTVWFDNVTIHDSAAQSAFFEVSGSQTPPTGLYYDAELVFAGEGNLESAYFTQLGGSLGLFYLTNAGSLRSFPTYYGFSGDTGEAASDLVETYSNGIVSLSPGTNVAFPYLGNASLSLDPGSFGVAGYTGTSTVTSTTSSASTSTGGSSTTSTQSSPGVQPPSFPTEDYVIVGVVVAVVVIVIVAVLYRLRPASRPQLKETGTPPDQGGISPPPYEPGPGPSGPG